MDDHDLPTSGMVQNRADRHSARASHRFRPEKHASARVDYRGRLLRKMFAAAVTRCGKYPRNYRETGNGIPARQFRVAISSSSISSACRESV